ncbi:MAG: YfhO family protein [Anaerolineae bacterium]
MRRGALLPDTISLVSLLALVLLFFWKIALTNLILVGLDVFTYFYPYREYAAQVIRAGHLPLWNPYLFLGVPFLANIQSAVLYPLNLLFLWLPAPKMVAYSIVLHIFLAGVFTYLYARRALKMSPWGALVAAVVFGLSGFLGAQAEHVNQLSVFAWLPLLLFLFHEAYTQQSVIYGLFASLVVGLQFLAGHAQASFINLSALGCYAIYLSLKRGRRTSSIWKALGLFMGVALLGIGLAAAQLLPTLELSRLSLRGGGLTYRQAVSFSLRPTLLPLSLLPSFDYSPFSEYIAYVGITSMLLASLALLRRRESAFFGALALLGIFLALGLYNPFYYLLYRSVPGFSLFRVPARWLFLYTFGMAILAGLGMEEWSDMGPASWGATRARVASRSALLAAGFLFLLILLFLGKTPLRIVLIWLGLGGVGLVLLSLGGKRGALGRPLLGFLLVGELFLASRYLAYDRATAPESYSSLRTAVTHLLADEGLYRVLSVSDTSFDPGDLGEIQQIFEGQLSKEAIYDYVVATKWKEVLAPNLPLHYKIASVDGYDGGILPLARYIELERLFLPPEEVSLDGRMGERLSEIPPAGLLSLMNVKYVIRDKVEDVWVDGVYYDLAHRVILGKGEGMEISEIPWFPTTSLGLVSHLVDGKVEQGTPVAEVIVTDEEGRAEAYRLRAGIDTAEGEYEEGIRHQRGRVVRRNEESDDYYALIRLREPVIPQRIEVRYLLPLGELHLRGISLIDGRTGAHRSLVVSPAYRLVHSGDVKIYENLENLPRAFVVHRARILEAPLEAMKEEAFDPRREVILSPGPVGHLEEGKAQEQVSIVDYQPERVEIDVRLGAPGYLVLTDAYYPGWKALVDGRPAKIERADYYFRAVYLEEGEHIVEFIYDPLSFKVGVAISLASLALVIIGLRRR